MKNIAIQLCLAASVFGVFTPAPSARAAETAVPETVNQISKKSSKNNDKTDFPKQPQTQESIKKSAAVAVPETPSEAPEPAKTEEAAIEQEPPKIVNTTVIAEVDSTITVKLDGETLESTQVHRTEKGGLYVNAIPIFSALNNDFEFDTEMKALIVRRSQDGVVMELHTDTGIVKANGKALGKLPHFGEVSENRMLLTSNAISILSGTNSKFNKKTKEFEFELDARLKIATGFEIFVNDISLGNLNPAPKSVGPVLIMPLLPIAEALGHDVNIIDGGESVQVRRAQDSALFSLNMESGLVKLNGKPYGIAQDVTYIDKTNLLLPITAIEALTGTHVSTESGSNRIDINLDERLRGAKKPVASVEELAGKTPFTPESLSFDIAPETINTVTADFRVGKYNGRIRYEIPDLPKSGSELQPSWLSLDYAHINGLAGSIGDYSADFRELDGVGLRRIRGVSAHKVTKKARIAVAAGMPVTGSKNISDGQSRATFSGAAVGGRYMSVDGWEAGLAYKKDGLSNDQMAVLSAISGRLGRKQEAALQWDADGDIGVFSGSARERSVDVRFRANARYKASETISASANINYMGAEFLRSDLNAEDRAEAITQALNPNADTAEAEERRVPDTRRRGQDQLSLSATAGWTPRREIGVFEEPAASVRVGLDRSGVTIGSDTGSTLATVGASAAAGIKGLPLSVSTDISAFKLSTANGTGDTSGVTLGVSTYNTFKNNTIRTRLVHNRREDYDPETEFRAGITGRRFSVALPKEAKLSISPGASAQWRTGQSATASLNLVANASSGRMFGRKNQVNAGFGIVATVGETTKTNTFFNLSAARRLSIGKNLSVGLAYRTSFNGEHRIGLQLQGRYNFNEKRRYKDTKEGRGVLKGTAFYDKNRDGIRQDDEPGVPGVVVRVKGPGYSLRTDRSGLYTIQNIKTGLYDLFLDGRSLPLGFGMPDDSTPRATIGDGMLTELDIPIVRRGQIRGFAFDDADGDGVYTKGETRVEGAKLILRRKDGQGEPITVWSSSFGQYAFDDLPADAYEITVAVNETMGIVPADAVTVDLGAVNDIMIRQNIPLSLSKQTQLAEVITDTTGADPPG